LHQQRRAALADQGWTEGMQVTLEVENLFDAEPPMTPAGSRTDMNVIGREVWFGIRKHW
jgi:hypothetical protein